MIEMSVPEFTALLSKLTISDLDKVHTDLYMKFNTCPVWDTNGAKIKNIGHFIWWAKGHPDRVEATVALVNERLTANSMLPVRGPVAGTKYIKWDDFTKLRGFSILYEAIMYGKKPYTKDGYVSVNLIINLRQWAGWKSSSLSDSERDLANKVEMLRLSDLSKLNNGRRADQPALFPINMIG
jgi:hypothetical protein